MADLPRRADEGKLSSELSRLRALCGEENKTLGFLVESMTIKSHALLPLILSLPFLFPIPLPGVSIAFGWVIMMIGIAMSLGRNPWLPKRILTVELSNKLLNKIFDLGFRTSRRLEKVSRPRGNFLSSHPWVRPLNASIIAVCGLLMALPLPPGTNFPPAVATVLLSIGVLEEDSIFILLGYVAFALNLAFFAALLFFGTSGIRILLGI